MGGEVFCLRQKVHSFYYAYSALPIARQGFLELPEQDGVTRLFVVTLAGFVGDEGPYRNITPILV